VFDSSELWAFDPVSINWERIDPAFPGAMWPMRRALHASTTMTLFVDASMLSSIDTYCNGVRAWAKAKLSFWQTRGEDYFPPSLVKGISNSAAFSAKVDSALAQAVQRARTLTLGSPINYLVIYAGSSSDQGGAVVGDLFLFDTVTRLWFPPVRLSTGSPLTSQNIMMLLILLLLSTGQL
jgi:hypothetical protein